MVIKVGDCFTTNQGYKVTVVKYKDASDIDVMFTEPFEWTRKVRSGDLRKGKVLNYFQKSVYGVGYVGEPCGILFKNKQEELRCKSTWIHMIERCYWHGAADKYPAYVGCTVEEVWHNFQNFAKFFIEDRWRQPDWQLDKDIITRGNKVYGPNTCAFVPPEVNKVVVVSKSKNELPVGVDKVPGRSPYRFRISVNGAIVTKHFITIEEAALAYETAFTKKIHNLCIKYEEKVDPRILESLKSWRVIDDY